MNVNPLGSGAPITRLHGSTAEQRTQGSKESGDTRQDTVEISDLARYLGELKKLPDVRADKVATVRQALADGSYETPAKLDATVERLQEDLG